VQLTIKTHFRLLETGCQLLGKPDRSKGVGGENNAAEEKRDDER
jgi:hypothetical protein